MPEDFIEEITVNGLNCRIEDAGPRAFELRFRAWVGGCAIDRGSPSKIDARHAIYAYLEARLTREIKAAKFALKAKQKALKRIEKRSPNYRLKGII